MVRESEAQVWRKITPILRKVIKKKKVHPVYQHTGQ